MEAAVCPSVEAAVCPGSEAAATPTASELRRRLIASGEYVRFSRAFSSPATRPQDLVALTLRYLADFDLLPFSRERVVAPQGKSRQLSERLWDDGNRVFLKDPRRAASLYSRSIAAAPLPGPDDVTGGQQLSLGFANRSAAYFLLGKYAACLRDVDHALACNYPAEMRQKLLHRRRLCCHRMNKCEEQGDGELNEGEPFAVVLPCPKAVIPFQGNTEGGHQQRPLRLCAEPELPLPRLSYGTHEHLPNASSCLEVGYTASQGRFLLANRDIEPGDILIVEEPICSVLLPDFYLTHCNNCLRRCDAMIPCKTCQSAMYCSPECRTACWESSHHVECWLLPAFTQLDVGQASVFLLPLRMLLAACARHGGLEAFRRRHVTSPDGVASLCRHRATEPDFQLAWAVGVACIVNLLETQSSLLSPPGDSSDLDREALRLFVGATLLDYVGVVTTNCFSVTEFVVSVAEKRVDETAFGDAVYSTMSLLNHSCTPNALNSFHHGGVNVLMAKQPVKRGEQVSISYGGSFAHRALCERQQELHMNYHFECACAACLHSWPMFGELRSIGRPRFACSPCGAPLPDRKLGRRKAVVTCSSCRARHDLHKMAERVRTLQARIIAAYNELKGGSVVDLRADLAEAVKVIDRLVVSPCQLTVAAQQYLRYSLKALGNRVTL